MPTTEAPGAAFRSNRPRWDVLLASRHLGMDPAQARRWLLGYVSRGRDVPALVKRDRTDEEVTFPDFVELLYLRALSAVGVSVQALRKLCSEASNEPYPLTSSRPQRLGQPVGTLQPLLEVDGQLEFAGSSPVAWWPLGKSRLVVLRPGVNGSNPSAGGVPTRALHGLYVAEDRDAEAVADWFDVSAQAVLDAVEYEESLGRQRSGKTSQSA